MKTHAKNRLSIVGLIALCAGRASAGTGQFTPIGDLAGGAFASKALAISADGTVIVGQATDSAGQKPIRWTAGGGLQALTLLGGTTSGRANGSTSTCGRWAESTPDKRLRPPNVVSPLILAFTTW